MQERIACIFPGQGAQAVGMGKLFYEQFPEAREVFQRADELLSRNLSRLIFEGPSAELSLTKNCQIAIYVTSFALWKTVQAYCPSLRPSVVAGLSLGEYTALTVGGFLSFEEGVFLVEMRGELMNQASQSCPGSMAVVLGMTADEVEKVVASLRPSSDVWIANINCPGQTVISGGHEGLRVAERALREAGAKRVLPLDVSGAFHSPYMEEAKNGLTPLIQNVPLSASSCNIAMNVPGDFVRDEEAIRKNLIHQIVEPVRWEQAIRAMEARGIGQFLEIGPGKTLAGMNKRIGATAHTLSIESPDDLKRLEAGYAISHQ